MFFSRVSRLAKNVIVMGSHGVKYLTTLKTPRTLTSKVFHHALGSFLFSTWMEEE